jgi:hypothetical protein
MQYRTKAEAILYRHIAKDPKMRLVAYQGRS